MAQACPLVYRQVDATLTRINALWTVTCAMMYLITQQPWWMLLLGTDFAIRLYGPRSLSPFLAASKVLKGVLRLRTRMSDAGPKRLAAQFGLLFSVTVLGCHGAGFVAAAQTVGAILALCASLELLFNYCVGCRIYYLWQMLKPAAEV